MKLKNFQKLQFKECETCSAKPGSPTLCYGGLYNRTLIDYLRGICNQALEHKFSMAEIKQLKDFNDPKNWKRD